MVCVVVSQQAASISCVQSFSVGTALTCRAMDRNAHEGQHSSRPSGGRVVLRLRGGKSQDREREETERAAGKKKERAHKRTRDKVGCSFAWQACAYCMKLMRMRV